MTGTVTVRHLRGHAPRMSRYTIEFSQLPGQTFGPWDFAETIRDLRVSALMTAIDARNLVLTAHEAGEAWTRLGRG